MKHKIIIALIVSTLIAAFAFWWFSPVQVLKRRTHALLETITFQSGTGQAGRQIGVYSLTDMLAPNVELDTDMHPDAAGSFERAQLESAYSWLSGQAKQTRFKLEKFQSIEISGDHADVSCTVEALVELPNYRPADGRYDVKLHWLLTKDGWRLSKAAWHVAKK